MPKMKAKFIKTTQTADIAKLNAYHRDLFAINGNVYLFALNFYSFDIALKGESTGKQMIVCITSILTRRYQPL